MWDIHVTGCQFAGITGRECPSNCLRRNTVPDMDVFSYVRGIVIINEIAMIDLPECYESSSRQKKTDPRNLFIF